jgi:hypothetical protein
MLRIPIIAPPDHRNPATISFQQLDHTTPGASAGACIRSTSSRSIGGFTPFPSTEALDSLEVALVVNIASAS